MKKKIISLCLIVALAITAVTGATLAYFTDVAEDVQNNFTIGNVQIELDETAKVLDKDGNEVDDALEKNDDGGYNYSKLMPTYKLEKKPTVTNTGDYTAYVRVAVVMNNLNVINDAIDGVYEELETPYTAEQIQAVYDNVFNSWGVNYSKRAEYPNGSRMWMDSRVGEGSPVLCNIDTLGRHADNYYRIDCANAFMTDEERASENGDGIYDVNWDDLSVSYYVNAAETDERVYVFYLELDAAESYTLFDGLNIPADFTAEQMAMFEGLKISVYADAIQTAGFDTYTDAFNALEAEHPLGWWN